MLTLSDRPLVTVVIATWNRKVELQESLRHFMDQTYSPIEFIVVDNGSDDGTHKMMEEEFPQVKLVRLSRNAGVGGYNVGMQAARGEIVVVSDNDSYLESAGIEKIVSKFKLGSPLLAVAACEIVYVPQQTIYNWYYLHVNKEAPSADGYPAHTFIGAGAAIKKNVLEQVGYYPEEFFLYMNEVDLSTRIIAAGFEVRYFPDIIAYHRYTETSRSKPLSRLLSFRNAIWYYWRHFPFHIALGRSLIRIPFDIVVLMLQGTDPRQIYRVTVEMLSGLPEILRNKRPIPKQYVKKALGHRGELSNLVHYTKEVLRRKVSKRNEQATAKSSPFEGSRPAETTDIK